MMDFIIIILLTCITFISAICGDYLRVIVRILKKQTKVFKHLDYFRKKYSEAIQRKDACGQLYYQGIIDYLEGKIEIPQE